MTPDKYTIGEHMLAVGDGHTLYIQDWGNKDARRTFLYLHGGPGSGCSDSSKQLFEGTRDHVVFFDQRGTGKSVPVGSLKANTTPNLVSDIERIFQKLQIEKAILIGGSWGACLALAFALEHPSRVEAMILRGIFTGSHSEIDHVDKGGFRDFFPEAWENFVAHTPAAHKADPAAYHTARVIDGDYVAVKESAYALTELEGSASTLDDRHVAADFETFSPNRSKIEVHYTQNNCFMPDKFILENAHKLTMPVRLIQGRYDMICPPVTAYELHKVLPNSELVFTISGHSGNDRGNFDAVRSIISSLAHE